VHLAGPSLKRPVVVGKEALGLYVLDRKLVQEAKFLSTTNAAIADSCNKFPEIIDIVSASCTQASKAVTFDTWHCRVGHIPIQKMKLLPIDIVFAKNNEHVLYHIYLKAKQQTLPFQLSTISTSASFELIHFDTWGPYHTKTYLGHRFFLTIMDDYTKTIWTHLMVTKDEALGLFQSFVAMAHTQFSCKVKTIRSDNALELTKSTVALEFFTSTRILHQTSCMQTPHQNGVVERKHKHLLEVS